MGNQLQRLGVSREREAKECTAQADAEAEQFDTKNKRLRTYGCSLSLDVRGYLTASIFSVLCYSVPCVLLVSRNRGSAVLGASRVARLRPC